MDEVIYGEDKALILWAASIIKCKFRDDAKAIGLKRDGVIIAATVFDGFSECDCNMHIASNGSGHWLTRKFLISSFAYPFIQLKLRRVTGLVPAKNTNALRFDHHLGFITEGVCRYALPDDDIVVLGLLREDCRFIHPKYRG